MSYFCSKTVKIRTNTFKILSTHHSLAKLETITMLQCSYQSYSLKNGHNIYPKLWTCIARQPLHRKFIGSPTDILQSNRLKWEFFGEPDCKFHSTSKALKAKLQATLPHTLPLYIWFYLFQFWWHYLKLGNLSAHSSWPTWSESLFKVIFFHVISVLNFYLQVSHAILWFCIRSRALEFSTIFNGFSRILSAINFLYKFSIILEISTTKTSFFPCNNLPLHFPWNFPIPNSSTGIFLSHHGIFHYQTNYR